MAGRGINKVILVGNLGADPEVRYTQNQEPVANLRVATAEVWRDRNTGEQQERTEWHTVAIFGKLAEVARDYLRKGSKVYLEGKLRTRKWQTQEGHDRYTTEVLIDITGTLLMLDSRQSGDVEAGGGVGATHRGPPVAPPEPGYRPTETVPVGGEERGSGRLQERSGPPNKSGEDFGDDIPF